MTSTELRTGDPPPVVAAAQSWACCHCGTTGLTGDGDTCPHCNGAGLCHAGTDHATEVGAGVG